MEKRYKVYKHTFPNGKVYIGITNQSIDRRWRNGHGYLWKDKNGKYRQPAIARAILKYGWENVLHDILFFGLTKEEAEKIEIELIAFYKSNNRDFGYNIESGGCANKISEATKLLMSESKIGKKNHKSKQIAQYTKDGVFIRVWDCAHDIERELHIDHSTVIKVCKGYVGYKTCGGFIWKYYDKNLQLAS